MVKRLLVKNGVGGRKPEPQARVRAQVSQADGRSFEGVPSAPAGRPHDATPGNRGAVGTLISMTDL